MVNVAASMVLPRRRQVACARIISASAVNYLFASARGLSRLHLRLSTRRSALKLENNHRRPLTIRAKRSPQGRGVRSGPGRALEPAQFTVNSPARSCFHTSGAGNPEKDRPRMLIERRTGLGLGGSARGPLGTTCADGARSRLAAMLACSLSDDYLDSVPIVV